MGYRFAISMRVTNSVGYEEVRDAIARDWPNYMMAAFPKSKWLFVPNIGNQVTDYMKNWDINVLILTGGDNIGLHEARDHTELELLKYAITNKIPVIAICRGLQLVHTHYGGRIVKGNDNFVKIHRAKLHKIKVDDSIYEVNSYHKYELVEESVHKDFEIWARCTNDNSIEGLKNDNILAMMWHPERDPQLNIWNKQIIANFIKNEK